MFELSVLTVGILELCLFAWGASKWVFLFLFAAWRLAYNLGLGMLLKKQSDSQFIVRKVKEFGFDLTDERKTKSATVDFLIGQVSKKFEPRPYTDVPIEFIAWLLFRGLVDMILVNDFLCYLLFSASFFQYPVNGVSLIDLLRYTCGSVLIAFNLWVKMDAHRVVKDFAWYWGIFLVLVVIRRLFLFD